MAIASVAWGNGPIPTSLELSLPDEEVNRMDSLIESWFSDNPAIRFVEEEYRFFRFAATDTLRYNWMRSPGASMLLKHLFRLPITAPFNPSLISIPSDAAARYRRCSNVPRAVLFSMIEEELDRRGLPMELKYVVVIESALNTHAVSKAGATWSLAADVRNRQVVGTSPH